NCNLLSEGFAERLLEFAAIAAAQSEARAVVQDDDILAVEHGLHLAYAFDVDERGAMDAQETCRVNLRFETADRFAQQISRRPDVQTDVVAVSFDPINFGSFEKEDAPAGFHDDTFERACAARLLCAEQCSRRLLRLFRTSQLRFGARERLP